MKTKVFALCLIIFAAVSIAGQNLSPAEKEVRKLERAWLDAYENKDPVAMKAIVAEDFTITFTDGSIQTKKQIIDSLARPSATETKFRTEEVKSRVYGDTVILIGLVIAEWKQNGLPISDRSRYTDTYVKRNGKWQVVASHLSTAAK